MDQPTGGDPATHPARPSQQPTWNERFSQLDNYAEKARTQLPAAPPGLIDGYMTFMPWIAIIFGALGVLGFLAGMGIGAFLSPFLIVFGGAAGVSYGGALFLALLVGLCASVLDVVGGYLMLRRTLTGWWILAAGLVVGLLNSLVGGALLTLIIILLVAYVHLQVKPNYH